MMQHSSATGVAGKPALARHSGGAGVIACALVLLNACGHKKAPAPPPPPQVEVVTLKSQPVSLTTELPGRTVAFKGAEIRPQVSGVILRRLFTEGGDVRMGQQLYQIDSGLYRAAYESAAATAESAKAQAERFKPLAEVNAVS